MDEWIGVDEVDAILGKNILCKTVERGPEGTVWCAAAEWKAAVNR